MFDVVFFAVIISTLLQGSLFEPFARALHLAVPAPAGKGRDHQGETPTPEPTGHPHPERAGPDPTSSRLEVAGTGTDLALAVEDTVELQPWKLWYGDPRDPDLISGVIVVELIRQRHDQAGALVGLEDGRFAVSGTTLALGAASALQAHAERMVRADAGGEESRWWHEVATALAEIPPASD
jgi:hypothetical protein